MDDDPQRSYEARALDAEAEVVRLRAAIKAVHERLEKSDWIVARELLRLIASVTQPEPPKTLQAALGLSDEQMAEQQAEVVAGFARIRESERQAALATRDVVLGAAAEPCPCATPGGALYLDNLRRLSPSRRTIAAAEAACTCGQHRLAWP